MAIHSSSKKIILGSLLVVLVGGLIAYNQNQKITIEPIESEQESVPLTEGGGENFHPVSIPAYTAKTYDGRDFKVGQVLADNETYTRYYVTYMSGALKISGIMNVPKGDGPFPVLFLNHGHIDTAVYTNGRGLRREQDYLARRGYIVIHSDYRNHAQSDKDPDADLNFRLGYAEDVINAVYAVRNSDLTYFDKEKIGMLGHSMGGGVTQNIMVIEPGLVDAAVLFAPVSGDNLDNFKRWTERRAELAKQVVDTYGTPEINPEFWHDISMVNFLDKIITPIMLHHGTADESVPLDWSNRMNDLLKEKNKNITYYTYDGQPHEFTSAWGLVMQRTVEFFDKYLKS
jgi:uncharacterized protein